MITSKFIVVEGIEGAGKTQACTYIKNILNKQNIRNIILVRQPGSTPIAEEIRKLIKKKFKNDALTKETELLLMYAARTQLVKKIIQPALKKGIWVISDRHDLSSLAYQGGGLGIKSEIIKKLKTLFIKELIPDLTVYLDVLPKIGLWRISKRNKLDNIESRTLKFFTKTRKKYLKNIKIDEKNIHINANLNLKIVNQKIKKKILNWFHHQII